jgi:hypothetical protein
MSQRTFQHYYPTGTVQGCRTAASVSKAAANQHNLPAGESLTHFGMDSMTGNQNTFNEPDAQRTDAVIIIISSNKKQRWCLTSKYHHKLTTFPSFQYSLHAIFPFIFSSINRSVGF